MKPVIIALVFSIAFCLVGAVIFTNVISNRAAQMGLTSQVPAEK